MHVTMFDAAGLMGVALMLVAYGATIVGRMDATQPAALMLNLVGALLVLVSLYGAFNLSSTVIESAWALIAAGGLVRHFTRR